MTQDEIVKMAREAGFDPHDMSADFTCNLTDIERFAALVAAAEREECAIAGGAAALAGLSYDAVAAAIRARGQHD
jgi:hypothetical protein